MQPNRQWFHDMADDGGTDGDMDDEDGDVGDDGGGGGDGCVMIPNNEGDDDGGNEGDDGRGLCTDGQGVNTNSTSEGLGTIHPPYGCIITDCITNVFRISTPKDWQLLLIQAIVFNENSNKLRALCIRRTGDGKSLPIQCAATMRRYVTIVIVPLLSVGLDQASNIYYSCNKKASVYAEHLDSISED